MPRLCLCREKGGSQRLGFASLTLTAGECQLLCARVLTHPLVAPMEARVLFAAVARRHSSFVLQIIQALSLGQLTSNHPFPRGTAHQSHKAMVPSTVHGLCEK